MLTKEMGGREMDEIQKSDIDAIWKRSGFDTVFPLAEAPLQFKAEADKMLAIFEKE